MGADNQILVSGSYDKTIKLWNIQTGECLKTLDEHTNKISSVAITPDNQILVSGSYDKTIRHLRKQQKSYYHYHSLLILCHMG
ncbi:MAG: hypothetical protein AAFX80_23470 [Cyanobacteria bacterium J06639_18]